MKAFCFINMLLLSHGLACLYYPTTYRGTPQGATLHPRAILIDLFFPFVSFRSLPFPSRARWAATRGEGSPGAGHAPIQIGESQKGRWRGPQAIRVLRGWGGVLGWLA